MSKYEVNPFTKLTNKEVMAKVKVLHAATVVHDDDNDIRAMAIPRLSFFENTAALKKALLPHLLQIPVVLCYFTIALTLRPLLKYHILLHVFSVKYSKPVCNVLNGEIFAVLFLFDASKILMSSEQCGP